MARHQPQTSIVTLMQLTDAFSWANIAIFKCPILKSQNRMYVYVPFLYFVQNCPQFPGYPSLRYELWEFRYRHLAKFATGRQITFRALKWQNGVTQGAVIFPFGVIWRIWFICIKICGMVNYVKSFWTNRYVTCPRKIKARIKYYVWSDDIFIIRFIVLRVYLWYIYI